MKLSIYILVYCMLCVCIHRVVYYSPTSHAALIILLILYLLSFVLYVNSLYSNHPIYICIISVILYIGKVLLLLLCRVVLCFLSSQ